MMLTSTTLLFLAPLLALPISSLPTTKTITSSNNNNKPLLLHPRTMLTCGSTQYSTDEYYCNNGQLIAVLPHGVDGSTLPAPANQPQSSKTGSTSPSPVPAGQIPHEGTVHTDDGSGSGSGNGNGGSGHGNGNQRRLIKRQMEAQGPLGGAGDDGADAAVAAAAASNGD